MTGWRTVMALAVVALVALGLAGRAWMQARAPLQVVGQGEPLLPQLQQRLDAVARLVVQRGNRRFVLRRQDGVWLAGDAAWPVPATQVHSVLVTLAEMRKVRPATALPERYRHIQVDDPSPESLATRLVLKDASGAVLADVILGREAADWLGGGRTAQFVRLAGERQSWLVEGHVRAPLRIAQWADVTLLQLPVDELEAVDISRHDGEVVHLVRTGKGQAGQDAAGKNAWSGLALRLQQPPPGAKPNEQGIQRLVHALENLSFEDVRRDDFLAGDKPQASVHVRARDGLVVTLQAYHRKGEGDDAGWWLRAEVTTPGSNAQRAEKLRQRFKGRAFRVYDSIGEILSAGLDGFIKAQVHELTTDAEIGGKATDKAATDTARDTAPSTGE